MLERACVVAPAFFDGTHARVTFWLPGRTLTLRSLLNQLHTLILIS
jgi:hypothetical protein